MGIEIKSHAVATFFVGIGYRPLAARVAADGQRIFVFRAEDVKNGLPKYGQARTLLDILLAESQQ